MASKDNTAVSTIEQGSSPAHVAIIMDGNGRWAKARFLPRIAGHRKGANAVQETVEGCIKLGIDYLTLYAFSSENWNRSTHEVNDLMDLLRYYLEKEIKTLHKNGVRIRIIGDRERLTPDIRERIENAESLTKDNHTLNLTVALSYGSRQEMVQAVQAIAEKVEKGEVKASEVNETLINRSLYTWDLPDPDLLIRTSGEQRLSNFLLWQSAYTELFFTDILWPDFTFEHLQKAVSAFQLRERRYGTT